MRIQAITAITKALVPGDGTVSGFEYGSPMPQDAVPMEHQEGNMGEPLQYEFHQSGVDYRLLGDREHGVLRIQANVHCDFRGNLKYAKDCANTANAHCRSACGKCRRQRGCLTSAIARCAALSIGCTLGKAVA